MWLSACQTLPFWLLVFVFAMVWIVIGHSMQQHKSFYIGTAVYVSVGVAVCVCPSHTCLLIYFVGLVIMNLLLIILATFVAKKRLFYVMAKNLIMLKFISFFGL